MWKVNFVINIADKLTRLSNEILLRVHDYYIKFCKEKIIKKRGKNVSM